MVTYLICLGGYPKTIVTVTFAGSRWVNWVCADDLGSFMGGRVICSRIFGAYVPPNRRVPDVEDIHEVVPWE